MPMLMEVETYPVGIKAYVQMLRSKKLHHF